MKRLALLMIILTVLVPLMSCGTSETPAAVTEAAENTGEATAVTLTIGDLVLDAYITDSVPGRSLLSQLPLTVILNDSDNDFCGDRIDIEYSAEDVDSGYQNGDLCFWIPASSFVIFVSGEESSAGTGNLVKLGHVTSEELLSRLEGRIEVTIALKEENVENTRVRITAAGHELYAEFEDNATSRALIERMPMTLSMLDLYGREMCYRFGGGAFETENIRSDGYEVGDIAYWPPAGSLVILYEQNGEEFSRQQIGHIAAGVEVFSTLGDVEVTFEVAEQTLFR